MAKDVEKHKSLDQLLKQIDKIDQTVTTAMGKRESTRELQAYQSIKDYLQKAKDLINDEIADYRDPLL